MTYTSCIIVPRNQNGITLRGLVSPSTADAQPFLGFSAACLRMAFPVVNNYATFEPDFWLLDGSIKLLPDTELVGPFLGEVNIDDVTSTDPALVPCGWMSLSQTNGSALATVSITFFWSTNQSTDNLTLYFGKETDDYPVDITVAYLNSGGGTIRSDIYSPSSPIFSTNQPVSNFRTMVLTMRETNKPFRYYRITGIDFDDVVRFTGSEIVSARLVEQIDPTSLELPFNSLDIELFSDEGDFSIVEPSGFYASLQYKDPFDVYEAWDHDYLYMGRFYLTEWNSKSETKATFRLVDLIGTLEKATYFGEVNPAGVRDAWDMMLQIMDDAGLTFFHSSSRFDMDDDLQSIDVVGYFPTQSCREAIQLLSMAIIGYATCARNSQMWIHESELASSLVSYDYELTGADKGIESPLELRTLVTGVEVTAHNYSQQTNPSYVLIDIFDANVGVGDVLIIFGKPIYGLDYGTGSTITATYEFSGTYLLVHVTGAGHLRVRGYEYVDGKFDFSEHNPSLPDGTDPNVLRVEEATTISPANADDIVEFLYDYFSQRYILKTKLFAPLVAPGDSVLIDVQNNRQMAGIVESMVTNLSGGMTSEVKIVGVIVPE